MTMMSYEDKVLMRRLLKKYISSNVGIHCPTKEMATKVLAIGKTLDFRWLTGEQYTDIDMYSVYEDKTCYFLSDGQFGHVERSKQRLYTTYSGDDFINAYNIASRSTVARKERKLGANIVWHTKLSGLTVLVHISSIVYYPLKFMVHVWGKWRGYIIKELTKLEEQ